MSILIIEVLPQGMIFAADRAVTITRELIGGGKTEIYQAQEVGSKVIRWPRGRALIGAVGSGEIGSQSTHDWLFDFMGDHVDFSDAAEVATTLRDRLQNAMENQSSPQGLIVEFGAFTKREGLTVPVMWHVTNVHRMNNQTDEYDPPTSSFGASEEILGHHLKDEPLTEVRAKLEAMASTHDPFWFHQGIDLVVFNTLEQGVKSAFRTLQKTGKLQPPRSLVDWERHARMWVLLFAAYFEAFGGPGEKFVGGGADVLSIPWPLD